MTIDTNNLYVTFVELKENKAIFISHELKKMYFVELDTYDLNNTVIEQSYRLYYTPQGWGRHKIFHNGKKYKLYEI